MATTNAAAMLAKSDSEDSDFDPKAVAPSEMDSVAAEAFHEQDAVPEQKKLKLMVLWTKLKKLLRRILLKIRRQ